MNAASTVITASRKMPCHARIRSGVTEHRSPRPSSDAALVNCVAGEPPLRDARRDLRRPEARRGAMVAPEHPRVERLQREGCRIPGGLLDEPCRGLADRG